MTRSPFWFAWNDRWLLWFQSPIEWCFCVCQISSIAGTIAVRSLHAFSYLFNVFSKALFCIFGHANQSHIREWVAQKNNQFACIKLKVQPFVWLPWLKRPVFQIDAESPCNPLPSHFSTLCYCAQLTVLAFYGLSLQLNGW